MANTELIIVEGLPASGKSTTANMIAKCLRANGGRVVCADEGTPNHPADYDVYDFPDFATERKLILDKWRSFVKNADCGTVYVFNCLLLQNPMSETMMRFAKTEAESKKYIAEIADIIRPLNPLVLYLCQSDVLSAIERVKVERGNGWLNAVIDYHVNQGYGKENGLSGFDGYIQCLNERKARELRILKSIGLRHIILNTRITDKDIARLLQ